MNLSSLIPFSLPSYCQTDYPLFVEFVETYFKFIEQSGYHQHFLNHYQDNLNIDLADNEFINNYFNEFVATLPQNNKISNQILIKYIEEFHLAVGSEPSYKFLFRILYDANVEINYPRDHIFKSSDNTWNSDTFLNTSALHFKLLNIKENSNIKVTGRVSNAVAIVDSLKLSVNDNQEYIEFELSSYNHDFIINEEVEISVDSQNIIERIIGGVIDFDLSNNTINNYTKNDIVVVNGGNNETLFNGYIKSTSKGELDSYNIINGGLNYDYGDVIYSNNNINQGFGYVGEIVNIDNNGSILNVDIVNSGSSFTNSTKAKITSINGNNADITLNGANIGLITSIQIVNSGLYFNDLTNVTVTINGIINNEIIPILGCVFKSKERYYNIKGFTSHNARLLDSFYYNHYSYTVKSKVLPNLWKTVIKKNLHPAGTELFMIWEYSDTLDLTLSVIDSNIANVYPIITIPSNNINISTLGTSSTSFNIIKPTINGKAGINLSELDNIKFNMYFNWTIQPFLDYSINDLYNNSNEMLYNIENSEILIT